VDLDLSMDLPSQLSAVLVSPSGTVHVLFDRPLTQQLESPAEDQPKVPTGDEAAWPGVFTMGLTAFMGESSAGTWTLRLVDTVSGEAASFNSFAVRAWGKAPGPDNQYVFTDEYRGTNTLADAAGVDTINAAAVSAAVSLSLLAGRTSLLPAGSFTLASGTVIENAIGGAGNDTITGNALNNVLRGNEGNDTIGGGAGIDTAVYGGARGTYTLASTAGSWTVSGGVDGLDSLAGVERLRFADRAVALDLDGNAGSVAQIIRAVFGPSFLTNRDFVGIGLQLFDGGTSYKDVVQLAVGIDLFAQLAGGRSNEAFVNHVYKNVIGVLPSAADLGYFAGLISSGVYTQASLAELACTIELNTASVDLVGLATTGIEFVPLGP
jgi:subtilisin-like proprotein convertase family protein